mmetsp:Transcript_147428/g.282583  ORF Transcript_147428/g.282583 Transcript_147428/m.282583 type:complete len:202 (+) Transcript_147428:492-1097(+)
MLQCIHCCACVDPLVTWHWQRRRVPDCVYCCPIIKTNLPERLVFAQEPCSEHQLEASKRLWGDAAGDLPAQVANGQKRLYLHGGQSLPCCCQACSDHDHGPRWSVRDLKGVLIPIVEAAIVTSAPSMPNSAQLTRLWQTPSGLSSLCIPEVCHGIRIGVISHSDPRTCLKVYRCIRRHCSLGPAVQIVLQPRAANDIKVHA